MLCYFARDICSVLLHLHFLQYVRSAQYGGFRSLCFPVMLLRYCLSDFEMVPIVPLFICIDIISHSTCSEFLLLWSSYFKIFWASFLITFLSPRITTSINMHVSFLLLRIIFIALISISIILIVVMIISSSDNTLVYL